MAQSRAYSLLLDTDLRCHVNRSSLRANPTMKSTQIITCGNLELLLESMTQVRLESNVCIVSCLTPMIANAEGPSTISLRVDPVLQDVKAALYDQCLSNPDRFYTISPPMYRVHPLWYREGLPEILSMFSQAFSFERPENLLLLSSFPTPEYEKNGVHLTAYSGLEYISHLYDSSNDLIEALSLAPPAATMRSTEATRVLEDRVTSLEQDHRRLNTVVEFKAAQDAEINDCRENERMEDYFVIAGLDRIPADLVGKAWQERAVKDVQEALKTLMGREYEIVVVHNSTRRVPDAEVTYTVKLASVDACKSIRTKFGSYFLGGKGDQRPPALKHLSIKNRVTSETKVRIDVLKLIAKRYRDSNPGARVQVIGYQPRPVIKITPPSSASDRRLKVFNYVEAVTKLPTNWSASEIEPIMRRINPELYGRIRSLFIVLSDDQFKKREPPKETSRSHLASSSSATSESSVTPMSIDGDHEPPEANGRGINSTRGRNPKRGASSTLSGVAKK